MIPINYVKWGLANRFDDCIEMSESLKSNPRLHNAILDHELGHKKTNTFKRDFMHDLTPLSKVSQREVVVFMLTHPRTLTQVFPFYWSSRRKQFIYDLNMVIVYTVVFGIIGFGLYFGLR